MLDYIGVPWEEDPEEPDGQMSFAKDFKEFMPDVPAVIADGMPHTSAGSDLSDFAAELDREGI